MKRDNLSKQLKDAYERLKEALAIPLSESPLALDGTIQRFEFTFELCWKTLKAILDDEGTVCYSPKSCLKEAFHLYNENIALGIYKTIKERHYLIDSLIKEISNA
ncbi:MAG: HI0074 family nucleotidyltransferase substrate-binding subunit [bacterium]